MATSVSLQSIQCSTTERSLLALANIAQEEGGVAVGEYPVPSPGPGEVLIKMQAAGICGTDMQIYKWAPRMRARVQTPRILGHEMAGHIVEAVSYTHLTLPTTLQV